MASARAVAGRQRALTLLSPNPDLGPVLTGSAAEAGRVLNLDEVRAGRMSLGLLGTLVALILAFYIWTVSVQGGG
jgi:hypothetical protein